MLLKVNTDQNGETQTLKNMHVPTFPEMALFQTDIEFPTTDADGGKVVVTYHPPMTSADKSHEIKQQEIKRLEIPLKPDVRGLQTLQITMHQSRTTAYNMGAHYNDWFSARFGYPVILAYLGQHSRSVLGSLAPDSQKRGNLWRDWFYPGRNNLTWLGIAIVTVQVIWRLCKELHKDMPRIVSLTMNIVSLVLAVYCFYIQLFRRPEKNRITFADCAPYHFISETSVSNVSDRLPEGVEMDHTKFRANIVVSGAKSAFEEDFWSELTITGKEAQKARLLLTGNCVRCQSLDVDFATGTKRTDEAGAVLKKLMKDRRVDRGARFNPVFGRYAFLDPATTDTVPIWVGDSVDVSQLASERTAVGECVF